MYQTNTLMDDAIDCSRMIAIPQMYQTNTLMDDTIEGSGMVALKRLQDDIIWEIIALLQMYQTNTSMLSSCNLFNALIL